jgi:hypothetical protein
MKKLNYSRRDFLKFLSLLPVGFMFGCKGDSDREEITERLETKESFKKLILALGPWSSNQKVEAENFAERFVAASGNTDPYPVGLINKIATRIPDNSIRLKKIDLGNFPKDERKLLIQFVQQLHNFLEIRNIITGEPVFGMCQTDNVFYTKALN